ncbi:hypothetical protein Hanom_Chr02g00116581 [Helianthus anomalus]
MPYEPIIYPLLHVNYRFFRIENLQQVRQIQDMQIQSELFPIEKPIHHSLQL